MSEIIEQNGECWEIEYGPGCDDCFGLGAEFTHLPSCKSDFCAGNGDEHSCDGTWLPCPTCGTMKRIRANSYVRTQPTASAGPEDD